MSCKHNDRMNLAESRKISYKEKPNMMAHIKQSRATIADAIWSSMRNEVTCLKESERNP